MSETTALAAQNTLDQDLHRRLFEQHTRFLGEPLEDRNSNRLCAGQFLLSSGTRGKRYAMPQSKVLLHQGSAGIAGTAMDIAIQADDLRHTRDAVLGCIAEDVGRSYEEVEQDSRRDRWFTAEQTKQGERTTDIYSRLLDDRVIYLGTGIDDGVANAVIAQLLHLQNDSADSPIQLYINSPGGSITATLAIYDTMQHIKSVVQTICVGQALASAAMLLAGGARGHRMILPHGRIVIHAPAAEGRGAIPDLILEADEIERVRALQESIIAGHTSRTAEQVRVDTERDLILTAEQAVDYGIVDLIVS